MEGEGSGSTQQLNTLIPDASSPTRPLRDIGSGKRTRTSQCVVNCPTEGPQFLSEIHNFQLDHGYADLLSPTPKAICSIPPELIPDGAVLPIASFHAQTGVPDPQTDVDCNNIDLSADPVSRKLNAPSISSDLSSSRVGQSTIVDINSEPPEATGSDINGRFNKEIFTAPLPQIGWLRPHTEQGLAQTLTRKGKHIMNHALVNLHSEKNSCNAMLPHYAAGVGLPAQHSSEVSIPTTGRRSHRKKISEGLRALKECVPSPQKGTKESALDDVIDYIKFLKFQVKALSQTRLGGEAIHHGLLHLEGFGHYLPHQQVTSDPLEEVIEQLMNSNMPAMIQFLEHKGLAILPMALAGNLFQTN